MMRLCLSLSEKILFSYIFPVKLRSKGKFPTPFLSSVPKNQRHEH
jgi:hypothetical protein